VSPSFVSPNGVSLVVDRDYGRNLAGLASQMPLWVVASAANLAHIEQARSVPHSRVTGFDDQSSCTPELLVADILPTIVEHHPAITDITIIGAQWTAELAHHLRDNGFRMLHNEPGLVVASADC
jgi:hypothetical protein